MNNTEYMREWRKDPEHKRNQRESQKRSVKKNHTHYLEYWRSQQPKKTRKYYEMKDELYAILGGKICVCKEVDCWHYDVCVIEDDRCLQLDHINGGGLKDFRRFNDRPLDLYKYYINHPDEARQNLQVLCANCNWTKKHRRKENN